MALEEYGYFITDKPAEDEWDANEYKILHDGSGGGTFARDNSQGNIVYICEYYYFEKFLDVILGKTVNSGTGLSRSASTPDFDTSQGSLPEAHPYLSNYFAASASSEAKGISSQDPIVGPLWKKAVINVMFRPTTYNILGDDAISTELDRFVSRIPEASAEFQTSLGIFAWCGKSTPEGKPWALDVQPAFVVPSTRWVYTWHQIPVATRSDGSPDLGNPPNIDTVTPLIGSINSDPFDDLYGKGSVLFSSWSPKLVMPSAATTHNYYWDIQYNFGVRDMGSSPYADSERAGWNFAFDPLRGIWDKYAILGNPTGFTMYPYADLNTLFEVTW